MKYFNRLRRQIAWQKTRIASLNLFGKQEAKKLVAEQLKKNLDDLKSAREFLR